MSRSDVTATQQGGERQQKRMQRTDWRYELKLRVPERIADQALAWARTRLAPDQYADPTLEDGYRISTLYFDTPTLAVFHQIGPDRRRKYRARRYGSEARLYLERKLKSSGRVRKYRSCILDEDLALLGEERSYSEWSGDWFRRRVRLRHLRPVCQVTYERVARAGELDGQSVRLTVDRQIRCARAEGLSVTEVTEGIPLLAGEAILELKFARVMPQAFKELLRELSLSPGPVSKYRLAVQACGLTEAVTEMANCEMRIADCELSKAGTSRLAWPQLGTPNSQYTIHNSQSPAP
jgi:hypothetical protein